jgi:hypothetical protein
LVPINGLRYQSICANAGFAIAIPMGGAHKSSHGAVFWRWNRGEENIMLGGNSWAAIGAGDVIAAIHGGNRRVDGHHRTRISFGPGCHLKPWGGFRSLALALETITMECGGALGVSSGGGAVRTTEVDALGMCSTNSLDGDNGERGTGSGGILAVGKGDVTLHANDDSGTLHADGGSNVSSGGDDATVSEGACSSDALVASKGDRLLYGDDGRGALRGDVGSDTSSGGGGRDMSIPDGDLVVGGALGGSA